MSDKRIKTLRFRHASGTSNSKIEATYDDGSTEDKVGYSFADACAVAKWFGLEESSVPHGDFVWDDGADT